MKRCLFIVFVLLIGCSCNKPAGEMAEQVVSDTSVIREYHSNGKIKTEISAVKGLREGLTRNYDREGRLLSQVNYVHNIKEGTAVNYYALTGKINSSLEYKNGIKHGDEKWFYENGQVYRISPYVNGKIEGLQQLFYENGNLMAQIPYKDGYPGTGLKEYKMDGTLVTDYPTLIIRKEDHLQDANKILLLIKLSNNAEEVRYYRGSLTDGRYLNAKLLVLATQLGTTQIDFNVPPGALVRQTVVLTANYKTKMGNPLILKNAYSLQAYNPN